MDLREYLFVNRLTVKEFSEKLDYSRTHLSGVIHGKLSPSRKLARAIEKATSGQVTAEEMMRSKNLVERKEDLGSN